MKWMVGVDPADLSRGAVAFAHFVNQRAPDDPIVGTHVIEFEVRDVFPRVDPDAVPGDIPPYVEALLDPLRADEAFASSEHLVASSPEHGLALAAQEHQCGTIVIGRRKPAGGRALVRLGRVARRLLRALPCPVVVVPPDATLEALSDGPILLATDLTDQSTGAARFAKDLAHRLDLDLLVTTVSAHPERIELYFPGELRPPTYEVARDAARERFGTWVAAHELGDARTSIVEGSVGPKLLEVASVAGASMIVVGSRGLGTLDRIFQSSVGSELAASAPVPVAVVPSGHT